MSAAVRCCRECRWWEASGQMRHGQCRRNPPVFIGEIGRDQGGTIKAAFAFPWLPAHFWCGEFSAQATPDA